jgi:hypothetical protein
MIVRSHELEWDRLIARAETTHQVVRLKNALDSLARLPGPHVPPEVHDALAAYPVTRRDRIVFWCSAGSTNMVGALPEIAGEYLAATRGKSAARVVATFPAYLRERWNLSSYQMLPVAVLRRGARSIIRASRAALRRNAP